MDQLFTILWFFLPAAAGNASGTLSNKVPILRNWQSPMDFGLEWGGIRVFGENKKFRGLILGTFSGILVLFLQKFLYENVVFVRDISVVDYSDINWLLIGVLQGGGALVGDAIESFFKRRMGIKPGGEWKPFDQIDFITAAVVFTLPFVQFAWYAYVFLFGIFIIGHRLTNLLAYQIGLKDVPY